MEENEKNEGWSYKAILLEIWSWVYSIGLALIAVLLVKNLLFSVTTVKPLSMYPTIQEYNMLIINRLDQVRGVPLEKGDIVVFEAPEKVASQYAVYKENSALDSFRKLFWKTLYVKRVIAVPGDQITIEKGVVYVNGERQNEEYVNPEAPNNGANLSVLVPEGYVFCMGDNRGNSWDSRNFGLIPVEKIEGTANFRIFPFTKFGNID